MPSSEETLRKQKVKTAGANGQPSEPARSNTELVVITGMSGSGKASVLKAFEDLGYYSVDNLPVDLIPQFAELVKHSAEITRAALVVDRGRRPIHRFCVVGSVVAPQPASRTASVEGAPGHQ